MREVDLPGGEGCARGLTGHADNQGQRELDPMWLRGLDPGEGQRIANDGELGGGEIVDRPNVAGKVVQAGTDGRARTEGVLEDVQGTGRNRLCHVKANRVVSCDLFGQVPRLGGRSVGDAHVRVVEVPSREPREAQWGRVVTALCHVREQVWQDPRKTVEVWRVRGVPVGARRTGHGITWHSLSTDWRDTSMANSRGGVLIRLSLARVRFRTARDKALRKLNYCCRQSLQRCGYALPQGSPPRRADVRDPNADRGVAALLPPFASFAAFWSTSAGRYVSQLGLVFAAYLLGGRIGLIVPFTSGNVSPVWPAAGIAMAALLLVGYRVWPAIATAAFFVNLFTPIPALAALGIAAGNTAGPLAGAWLTRQISGFTPSLTRLKDVFAIILIAAPTGAAIAPALESRFSSARGALPGSRSAARGRYGGSAMRWAC